MKYIRIGRIVNTHALKGEVRLISDFEYKDRVFIKDFILYIGQFKIPEVIETHRIHKQYDMIKFVGINYINDVLKYKGEVVYINEEDLKLNDNEILESDYVKGKSKELGNETMSTKENYKITEKLIEMPNVLITPHLAYNTKEYIDFVLETTFNNIRDNIKGIYTNRIC